MIKIKYLLVFLTLVVYCGIVAHRRACNARAAFGGYTYGGGQYQESFH